MKEYWRILWLNYWKDNFSRIVLTLSVAIVMPLIVIYLVVTRPVYALVQYKQGRYVRKFEGRVWEYNPETQMWQHDCLCTLLPDEDLEEDDVRG